MSPFFREQGYEIHRGFLKPAEVGDLAEEAARVAEEAGSACVRHLRKRSRLMRELASSEKIRSLLDESLRPVRAILFDKTPEANWPVAWHQDLTIAVREKHEVEGYGPWSHKDGATHVQPPVALLKNMVTIRIHLDPTPATNGALRVIPKSHLTGKITNPTITNEQNASAIICECNAGDILMMSPLVMHSSKRASSPNRRRILHFEYARDEDLNKALDWFEAR